MERAVAEVLIECADALELANVDRGDRGAHFTRIASLLASGHVPSRVSELLRAVEARMRVLSTLHQVDIALTDRPLDRELAAELRLRAEPAPAYVYHGTVFGRLVSIAEHGLVPAMKPVWRDRAHVRAHASQAVFFTPTWRGAVNWAEAAHHHARGRRDSRARRPVVVRIPSVALVIEPDPLAAVPGCLLVRGTVSTETADVFIAPLTGYPTWRPLGSLVRELEL